MKKALIYLLSLLSFTALAQNDDDERASNIFSSNQVFGIYADAGRDTIHDLSSFLSVSDYQGTKVEEARRRRWVQWHSLPPDSINQDILWLKIILNNQKKEDHHAILYLHNLQQVTIYETGDSTSIRNIAAAPRDTILAGTLLPFSKRQTVKGMILEGFGNSAQAKLQLPRGFTTLYLKTEFILEEPFNPQLKFYPVERWEEEVFKDREQYILLQGILLGALLILSIYHFLIFLQKRDVAFLWYSLYTFFTALVLMLEMGVAQLFILPESLSSLLILRKSLALHMTVAILYFLFMKTFIGLEELLPRLHKLLRWFFWVVIPSAYFLIIWYLIAPNPALVKIGNIYPISVLVVGVVCLIALIRTGNILARYFVIGSAFLILGVLLNTLFFHLVSSGFIDKPSFPQNYLTETGVLIEILVFSLGLGYRLRLLEKQKQHIEELDHAKSRFFANISHEFRTPLTVIMGVAAQIRGNEKEQTLIRRNSHNLLRLVNQLLELAKLESGALKLNEIQADVVKYLQYLTESFHSMAQEKEVQLLFYSEEKELVMDYDEEKIQHIVYNLLSNAIKFTGEGGKVVLHVREITEKGWRQLQIKVSDTGVGMAETELAHIFDRFYQVEAEAHPSKGGSGVGLALTKELVGLMGGRISVSSEPGAGSEFRILLPIKRQAPMARPATEDIPDYLTASSDPDTATTLKPLLQSDAATILLIEDNPDVAAYIESLLKKDYQLSTARNGQAGIDMALENVPDIIISDVMMPGKNGYEVCQELKTDERTSHIPIVLLTAKAGQEDKIEGLKGGADAYLTKPFDPEELFVRIDNLIEIRRKLQAHYTGNSFTSLVKSDKAPSLDDAFLQKLVTVVEERLDDPDLGVNDLCRAARLSNMQVNRKLKALTGDTPSRFIRSIRLEKAKELLLTTDLNVSEVAYDVGFKDPAYFSRAFSEKFGCPPNDMRR